jgi:hypothetical protein
LRSPAAAFRRVANEPDVPIRASCRLISSNTDFAYTILHRSCAAMFSEPACHPDAMRLHFAAKRRGIRAPMSDALFLLATVYRTVYNVGGSYIVARLAPDRPLQHALASGVVGLLLGTAGSVATWNRGLGPHWYPLAIIALAMPCAWAGGRLRVTQLRGRVDSGGKNAR